MVPGREGHLMRLLRADSGLRGVWRRRGFASPCFSGAVGTSLEMRWGPWVLHSCHKPFPAPSLVCVALCSGCPRAQQTCREASILAGAELWCKEGPPVGRTGSGPLWGFFCGIWIQLPSNG